MRLSLVLVTLAILLSWLSRLSHASAKPPQDPGHIFIPMGKIYPSYSSWAVTVSLSMTPYRRQLRIVEQATSALLRTAPNIPSPVANRSDPNRGIMSVAVRRLYKSIYQLSQEEENIRMTFEHLLPSPNDSRRAKRGLINGIRSIMSSLFGTATENEITHLTRNVQLINSKEMAMAHAFNGTLKVLNTTRVATTQNRKGLQALERAFTSMQTAEGELQKISASNEGYIIFSLRITSLVESVQIMTRSVMRLHSSLAALSDRLALAKVGILHSDLISDRDFERVLRKIAKNLPSNFALPYPAEQIQDYIRITKTKLIRNGNDFHILFYVPLLHTLHAFDVYRFFPYQVPLHDLHMSLTYIPDEPSFLVIAENRQTYIQASDAELEPCILAKLPYCQIHEPAYSTVGASSCIVSLFRHDNPGITKYCAPIARPTNGAPKAYYLANGSWLLVSRPPVKLTVVCPSGSTTKSVTKAIDIVQLEVECSAAGDSIFLPPYYASETHLSLPDFHPDQLLPNDTSDIPIWRHHWSGAINASLRANVSVLPTLHVAGIPANDYFNQVTAIPLTSVSDSSPSSFSVTWLLIIIIGLMCAFILWFIVKHCCPRARSMYTLPSYAAATAATPEPAIELLEPPPVLSQPIDQSPSRSAYRTPLEAVSDATPLRGSAPQSTSSSMTTVFGGRPKPRSRTPSVV